MTPPTSPHGPTPPPATPPTPPGSAPPGSRYPLLLSRGGRLGVAARIAAGLAAPALGALTFSLWFIGVITFTGCFIGCGTPQPFLGSLLLGGAVLAATGTIVTGWLALSGSTRHLRPVAGVAAGVAGMLAVLSALT